MQQHMIRIACAVLAALAFNGVAWGSNCTADIADDGQVNVNHLLVLLANWDTNGPGSAITEPIDIVDVADLLELLSQWGPCAYPSCGAPDSGNCFADNGTVGCEDESCCKTVCNADSFCCESLWDNLCIAQANDLCGDRACPGEGECFMANGTPGCMDETCCNLVCSLEAFCCDNAWDDLCVETAHEKCITSPQTGACCLPDGTCEDAVNNAECTILDGAFQGPSTSCDDVQCSK